MASTVWTRIIPLIVLAALIVAAVVYRMSNTVPNPSRGREIVQSSNVLSSRYKEMVLSRSNLAKVVDEFKLYPEVVAAELHHPRLRRRRVEDRPRSAGWPRPHPLHQFGVLA